MEVVRCWALEMLLLLSAARSVQLEALVSCREEAGPPAEAYWSLLPVEEPGRVSSCFLGG
jgi:hypothetical protein